MERITELSSASVPFSFKQDATEYHESMKLA